MLANFSRNLTLGYIIHRFITYDTFSDVVCFKIFFKFGIRGFHVFY